jgi:hypothetical protein
MDRGLAISKRAVVASAVALVAGMVVALGAVAAQRAIETNTLIFFTFPDILNGQVTSPEPRCMPNRVVTLKKQRSGQDRKVGTDKTSNGGFYEKRFAHPLREGAAYYAAVAKRHVNAGSCAADRSSTTTIPP